MDEKDLPFDRIKHVCYTPQAKQVMLRHLSAHYPAAEVPAVWETIQRQYVLYLQDVPYLGGEKNGRNGAGGTYDCIALMAWYQAQAEHCRPPISELYEMECELAMPAFQKIGGLVNVNHGPLMRLLNAVFAVVAKQTRRQLAQWPDDYDMTSEPFDPALGARYRFDRCPVADFARSHGLEHLLAPLCNTDYAAMEAMHGTLLRRHTCGNDCLCDYRIVGDQHPDAKKYPRKTDEKGFWYNDV